MGIATVAVFSADDAGSLHIRRADHAHPLVGSGPAAYLDAGGILAAAAAEGCDAIHPGYGFLSESAAFARRCHEAGLTFVGPRADLLELFGDKVQARALAGRCGVPVLDGSQGAATADEVRAFLASLGDGGAVVIKAVAGGGGRGMRVVSRSEEVAAAWERCRSEALHAFGSGDLYVERLMPRARHLEVQVLGDGTGAVSHLWERECTLQRRHQKLVEMAPSPRLSADMRARLLDAALRLAREVRFDNLGTFEFLLDATATGDDARLVFIEANPRLQVEHTVTEEVTGADLVKLQLRLAAGCSLAELGLDGQPSAPRGFAVQARVNTETIAADGGVRPAGGTLRTFELPSGPGVRVDTAGHVGYRTNPRFDSLLAKVVGHTTASSAEALARTARALGEFRIEGASTNLGFLRRLLAHPDVVASRVDTGFVAEHAAELAGGDDSSDDGSPSAALAGAKVDSGDPLAVLVHGKSAGTRSGTLAVASDGGAEIIAPMQGTIVSIDVREGDPVYAGAQLLVMEAMKMEHVVRATSGGVVRQILAHVGDAVLEGSPLLLIEESAGDVAGAAAPEEADLDEVRPDLAEAQRRQ
jgi:acetyl/propionyl-CoA carboxylase alpha subunit